MSSMYTYVYVTVPKYWNSLPGDSILIIIRNIYIYIYIYICYKVKSADISINVIYIYVELNLIQFGHYVISIYIYMHAYIVLGFTLR